MVSTPPGPRMRVAGAGMLTGSEGTCFHSLIGAMHLSLSSSPSSTRGSFSIPATGIVCKLSSPQSSMPLLPEASSFSVASNSNSRCGNAYPMFELQHRKIIPPRFGHGIWSSPQAYTGPTAGGRVCIHFQAFTSCLRSVHSTIVSLGGVQPGLFWTCSMIGLAHRQSVIKTAGVAMLPCSHAMVFSQVRGKSFPPSGSTRCWEKWRRKTLSRAWDCSH
mmetsp:Transcript_43548/g.86425  ORF Transcript_43548/g.86425 Transcript_43548/m.86425 type:complete len:218 (-) Transcript_43548:255-908(-)